MGKGGVLCLSNIGHAWTAFNKTLDHPTAAFSTARPHVEQARTTKGAVDPNTDHNAMILDFYLFKSLQLMMNYYD